MSFEAGGEQPYSLYLSDIGVELYTEKGYCWKGRFICSQNRYQDILEFGRNLAVRKGVPFIDHVALALDTYAVGTVAAK